MVLFIIDKLQIKERIQMNRRQIFKRVNCFFLAILLAVIPLLSEYYLWPQLKTEAANVTVRQVGGNLLDGIAFDFYGHPGREGIFLWRDSNNHPVFCIEPMKAMQSGAGLVMEWYDMDREWPTALDEEQKELLYYALAVAGCGDGNKNISTAQYIMVQSAIWAIVSGEWTSPEDFKIKMSTIIARVKNNRVTVGEEIGQMTDDFIERINTLAGDTNYIPSFATKPYDKEARLNPIIALGDGRYSVTFDNLRSEVKDFEYEKPTGWDNFYSNDGRSITFVCDTRIGGNVNEEIKGTPKPGSGLATLKGAGSIAFYIPGKGSNQIMAAQARSAKDWSCVVRFKATSSPISPEVGEGSYSFQSFRYEHKETFKSNYKVELYKSDAETGNPLSDTTFSILESFDKSQLKGSGLSGSQFPTPSELEEHVQLRTDENGYLSHSDEKLYHYGKTYCGGHPDPVIEKIERIETESEDPEELEIIEEANAEIDEKNERLEQEAWAAWQEDVDFCQEETDFHSIIEGEAEGELESDRNHLFSKFINLEYIYTVREVQARNGYILHDLHTADLPVPIISMKSSQAGGEGREIGTYFKGNASYTFLENSDHSDQIEHQDNRDSRNGWSGSYTMSEVAKINQNRYQKDNIGFIFRLMNHRTEGEIHINKQDLDLFSKEGESGYGKAQGDATLEGAVYGLYAAEDIIHPDGKTGKLFSAGDLISIAATDKNGDASFLVITEESETSKRTTNLYAGKNHLGINYPDFKTINGNSWIGRPLFLGSYDISEISRSEGYELSQYGIHLSESNRKGTALSIHKSGSASVGGFSHPINEWDGSWNEFKVKHFKTEDGYDIHLSGYPVGSKFYKVDRNLITENNTIIIGKTEQQKLDQDGDPLYYKAFGGEYKYDSQGERIPLQTESGEPVYDISSPVKETLTVTNRLNYYAQRIATSSNAEYYPELADFDFVLTESNELLKQIGYKNTEEGAPSHTIPLNGMTNGEWIESILDWVSQDSFWDSYSVAEIYPDDEENPTRWYGVIHFAYTAIRGCSHFYDPLTQRVILRKDCKYDKDGTLYNGYYYTVYPIGSYLKNGSRIVLDKKVVESPILYGELPDIQAAYNPKYAVYSEGDYLLDSAGNLIPILETVEHYGMETIEGYEEILTEIISTYDPVSGIHRIHVDDDTDWNTVTQAVETTFRAAAPEMEKDGMAYGDYIIQKAGGGVSVFSAKTPFEPGSYNKSAVLLYPGQTIPYQDGDTREKPIIMLQRIIKQAVKVVKTISLSSYDQVNTYSLHKDPFTVLYGGYNGKIPANSLPGFHFKIYLVSDLEKTGLLDKKSDGSHDYKKFFEDKTHQDYFDHLAIWWDDPKNDIDNNLTTLHANKKGTANYYGRSIMLPYGTYVIVEQQPTGLKNKHYKIDEPKEIILPFIPHMDQDGTVHQEVPSMEYFYNSEMTPEEMMDRYFIRFNEESHTIQAQNRDGDFKVYKYGLSKSVKPNTYENPIVGAYYKWDSNSENEGLKDQVYYEILLDREGNVTDYGITLNHVKTVQGRSLAVDRKYAHALVPWSVLDPRYGEIINDDGDIGNRESGLEEDGKFNFVAFHEADFENTFYKSKLRIEKIDSETGENIIHEGAIFKIYAAKRDVSGNGVSDVAGSGQVIFDENGLPVYDESEQIFMKDETGNEIGIFKAFTTIKEVVTKEGIKKIPVGYIETYQPLGAGVYVLVEIEAPPGYIKSKPVAFEVYSDEVAYYYNGNSKDRRMAQQYQYVIPFSNTKTTISQIIVEDKPSRIEIHKTEDGESTKKFEVRGSRDLLEARGDVVNITYDPVTKEWYGTVIKAYDKWSKNIVYGTEEQLKAMECVKLIYSPEGIFTGSGIRYDIYVKEAELTLFKGLKVTKLSKGRYYGVETVTEGGKTVKITAANTGTHMEINTHEKDTTPAKNDIWDSENVKNPPVELLFYDLNEVLKEIDQDTETIYILDERGNRISMADPITGMAYVTDDYGNIIVYPIDEEGKKVVSQSIKVHVDEDGKQTIYTNVGAVNDENGLPVYYETGDLVFEEDIWNSNGKEHKIARLPFGAYILEETDVPYDQGYIKTKAIGFIIKEMEEEQKFFLENDFTKIEVPKLDITTKQEIPDAKMVLYYGVKVEDNSPKGFHLEYQLDENGNKKARTSWTSGYTYDDKGNPILDLDGNPIPSTRPHWIDHIPVGFYILEETEVPHDYGYVKAAPVEVMVKESGEIQSFPMEDDYTQLEILKMDANKGKVLIKAGLTLYQAFLNEDGTVMKDEQGFSKEDRSKKILSWHTEDGRDVAATAHPMRSPDTGELIFDEAGEPVIGYDYEIERISTTIRGQYYRTETGAIHFDYLPIGFYVLAEEDTPTGYATADPLLIEVKEIGGSIAVQKNQMDDFPLTAEVSKVNLSGGKIVAGAVHRIYQAASDGSLEMIQAVDEDGITQYEKNEEGELIPVLIYNPVYLKYEWETGKDGVYQEGDDIPEGMEAGDLKPHVIQYIPLGDYYLVEYKTPYGFLRSAPIPFTVKDTKEVQKLEMPNAIPNGQLEIIKQDAMNPDITLPGALFVLKNETLGVEVETLLTGEDGKATSHMVLPIGYLNDKGTFSPYIYSIMEKEAPDDYMLQPLPHYFEFQYIDGKTDRIMYQYYALNEANQVVISKKMLTGKEELPGAQMRLEKIIKSIDEVSGKEMIFYEVYEEWISKNQPHYITGIPNGKYRLIEIEAPGPGFALAEPVEFEISGNMTEALTVTMYDEHTTIEIQKIASDTGKQLVGAKLQITDSKGEIRDIFVTTKESHYIYGLEPGDYILTELEAPEGYYIASPIRFQVTEQYEIQIIKMMDQLKITGVETEKPEKPEKPYISKEDFSTGGKLSNAWIVIYNPDGSLYAKGKTDSAGNFYFQTPPAGAYTYQEIEAPDGYFLNENIFTFTVNSKGKISGNTLIKDVKKQVVILNKKDISDGKELPGAEIEIYDENGIPVFRGVSDSEGKIYFMPPKPGNYTFREWKAPKGYKLNESVFTFTVHSDGSITGDHTILNESIYGYITAYYDERMNDQGKSLIRDGGEPGKVVWPPKLGDKTYILLFSSLSAAVSVIVLSLCRKKHRKSRTEKNRRNQ